MGKSGADESGNGIAHYWYDLHFLASARLPQFNHSSLQLFNN